MSLNATRASTVDGTAGLQVSTVTPEDGTAGVIQGTVALSNKTAYAEVARAPITAADVATDLSTAGFAGSSGANLFDIANCGVVQVRATCSSPSATLTGRLVFYDGSNVPVSLGDVAAITLTADATRRVSASGDYLAPRVLVDAGAARKARFFVEAVSAGTWSVSCRPL